jgi:hypothetical protein
VSIAAGSSVWGSDGAAEFTEAAGAGDGDVAGATKGGDAGVDSAGRSRGQKAKARMPATTNVPAETAAMSKAGDRL